MHVYPVKNTLNFLTRSLHMPETLDRNLGNIRTNSAENMCDLAISGQKLQEKFYFFDRKNAQKFLYRKKTSQEKSISTKNLGKTSRKTQEQAGKARSLKIPVYNLTNREKTRTTKVQEGNLKSLEIRLISIEKSIR